MFVAGTVQLIPAEAPGSRLDTSGTSSIPCITSVTTAKVWAATDTDNESSRVLDIYTGNVFNRVDYVNRTDYI